MISTCRGSFILLSALLEVLRNKMYVMLCKQQLLNHLSITHDSGLRKHCILSDPLTPPRGRLTGGQEIHREYDFHSLHCVYRDRLLIFSHIILEKYLGATRRPRYKGPRYNGVAVYQSFSIFHPTEQSNVDQSLDILGQHHQSSCGGQTDFL